MPADTATALTPESFQLSAYVEVLGRRWRVIVIMVVAATAIALGLALQQEKLYAAESDVLIGRRGAEAMVGDSYSAYAQSINAARYLNNEVRALESGLTRDAVAAEYDGPLDPSSVTVGVSDVASDVVTVRVKAPDPNEAAELVNTYVEVAIALRRSQAVQEYQEVSEEVQAAIAGLDERIALIRAPLTEVEEQLAASPGNAVLEARRDDLTASLAAELTPLQVQRATFQQQLEDFAVSAGIARTGGAELLTRATAPSSPVSPKPVQSAVLAMIVGLMLGIVVAFVRDSLDERIRDRDDLDQAAPGLPAMAAVPEVREPKPNFVAVRDASSSPVAEAYRSLRTSVKFAGLDHPFRVIQVTSAVPAEGKSTSIANLAEALAQGGERVAILCCDLRRPTVHERFDQPVSPGFTDVLLEEVPLASAVRAVRDRLFILPAGSPAPNPSELLSSARAEAVINALAAEFDVVLVDSTPVLPVTDALVVSRFVDATLVVVDVRTTKRKIVRQAIDRLQQVSAPIAGLILVGVRADADYGYGYAYTYGRSNKPASKVKASAGTS